MFTGIIETLGVIQKIEPSSTNLQITIETAMVDELKIDQSVAHNGICLTVIALKEKSYAVTAIDETVQKTNIASWKIGEIVNLERAMKLGDRLDGHIVQGHVDQIGTCKGMANLNGSWQFTFEYDETLNNLTIEKGSITVNGVSLTVVNSKKNEFSVAIIPYTYENTNFNKINIGSIVNLEFDVIGKYVSKLYGQK
jgi:riboflavin synthase